MDINRSHFASTPAVLLFVLACLFGYGCTDGFVELNTPTDRIVADELDAANLGKNFADAQWRGVRAGGGGLQTGKNLFADLYAQYFATTSANFDSDQFELIGSWVNGGAWRSPYSGALQQINFLREFTRENEMEAEHAIVKIWSLHIFHQLTDYFGPIIYSEHGNGERVVNYDPQDEIYMDFFKVLEEGVNVLERYRGQSVFGTNDIIFSGDVDKWIKYANSLRLRLAMRVSYAAPEVSKAQAEAAMANMDVMIDNEDSAWVSTTANNRNYFNTITEWMEFRMSAAMQSVLQGYEDPRIVEMFREADWTEAQEPCGGCGYRGLRNGLPRGAKNPELNFVFSDIGEAYGPVGRGGSNPPVEVLRASEVYFLRAEGALRGYSNMGGTAKELYEEGIRKSIEEWGVASGAEIESYITSTNTPAPYETSFDPSWNLPPLSDIPVAWDEAGDFERNLEQIITQKWIALYPEGMEAYAEYRRTKYPKLYPIIESRHPNIPEDGMVSRLTFASSEYSQNPEGIKTGLQALGGPDEATTKLWWDKK